MANENAAKAMENSNVLGLTLIECVTGNGTRRVIKARI